MSVKMGRLMAWSSSRVMSGNVIAVWWPVPAAWRWWWWYSAAMAAANSLHCSWVLGCFIRSSVSVWCWVAVLHCRVCQSLSRKLVELTWSPVATLCVLAMSVGATEVWTLDECFILGKETCVSVLSNYFSLEICSTPVLSWSSLLPFCTSKFPKCQCEDLGPKWSTVPLLCVRDVSCWICSSV
jgi:hypothetical protein